MEQYKPNLAQAMYGNPVSELACPNYIEAGLRLLAWYIETSEWNRTQEDYYPPTQNSGEDYKTNVFEMHAYYWGDDEALEERPNFKCGDFEVRWYKYVGRGMSMNQEIDANHFFELIDRCIESVPLNVSKWV